MPPITKVQSTMNPNSKVFFPSGYQEGGETEPWTLNAYGFPSRAAFSAAPSAYPALIPPASPDLSTGWSQVTGLISPQEQVPPSPTEPGIYSSWSSIGCWGWGWGKWSSWSWWWKRRKRRQTFWEPRGRGRGALPGMLQAADIFTKPFVNAEKWNFAMKLLSIRSAKTTPPDAKAAPAAGASSTGGPAASGKSDTQRLIVEICCHPKSKLSNTSRKSSEDLHSTSIHRRVRP